MSEFNGINYLPPPTVEAFMHDSSLVRVIVGPIGSGKSMGCIMELMRRAILQAPAKDGVRYTRFALVRNTLQQLRQTVLADVQQYLGPVAKFYATDSTIQFRIPLPDGTKVHSDWMMIPLDSKEDQRRLLSTQLTGAWVNECREVNYDIVAGLLERLGRYPSKINGGPTWMGIICDSNPWDTDSKYHENLVLNPAKGWQLFHQPSGIGPDAENLENLPPGYYENAMSGASEERISTQIRSEFGSSNAGQAVFRSSFHVADHVRDMVVTPNPMRPIMVGMDFGRTPCALITQVDSYGRLIIYEEIVTEDMGLIKMINERLRPALAKPEYVGRRVFVVGDPAGQQKSQATEECLFDVLREAGFAAYPASTNDVDKRIVAVERLMLQRIVGEAAIQINRAGCPILVRALGDKYRYRRKKVDDQLDDKPEKLHPWSDIADAMQYAVLGTQVDLTGWVIKQSRPRAITPRRITSAAWT